MPPTDFCIDCSGDQDVTLPRSYWRENTNYDLSANALAVKMYFKPSSSPVSVATGKVNSWLRGDIDYTLSGTALASLLAFNLTDSGSSSSSALYGIVGSGSVSGPGAVKAIYGRGVLTSGSTGVAVGLVGAITIDAGASAAGSWPLQLGHAGACQVGSYLGADTGAAGSALGVGYLVQNTSALTYAAFQYNQRGSAGGSFLRMFNGSGGNPIFDVDSSGNLLFQWTSQRIRGDLNNSTQSNRTLFQAYATDGNSIVGIIPNGTSVTSGVRLYNNSNPDAALGMFNMTVTATGAVLDSNTLAGGTQLPIEFRIGGTYAAEIKTNKDVLLGPSGAATNMTAGFPFIPAAAGTPTGTPTTVSGYVPLYVDTTNKKLCYYDTSAAAWRTSGVFT